MKFEEIWPGVSGEKRSKVWTDGRADDGRGVITIAHPESSAQVI